MRYATPADMVLWFGADELAGISQPDGLAMVSAQLLRLTVDGEDRSGYGAEEIEAADGALSRIQDALDDATRRMGSYLSGRYQLPLDAAIVPESGLPRICGDMARWLLHDDAPSEVIANRHDRALAWLRDVGNGKAHLAGADAPTGRGAGLADHAAPARTFDATTLDGF